MKKPIVSSKVRASLEETSMRQILMALYWWPDVEFSLTELAHQAKVSKSTVSRLLKTLKDLEIITFEDKGIVFRIKANSSNFQYIKRKIAFNLSFIYESGLVEFLEQTFNHPPVIILFGSFRKGEDVSTSDVDIAVETTENVEMQSVRPEGLDKFEQNFLERNIQIHVFNRKRVDANLFNNIVNGIILSGFLEVTNEPNRN